MYIAARALDLGNGQRREIGDPVPEAVSWRNLRAYVSQRWVLQVQEGMRLEQLDIDTQIRIRRLGIEQKLIGLGVLVGSGAGPTKTVAEVGQEIAQGARITTGEIETATAQPSPPEPMAEEPTPDEGGALKRLVTAKRKKGKR